jgi:hypothetical protein
MAHDTLESGKAAASLQPLAPEGMTELVDVETLNPAPPQHGIREGARRAHTGGSAMSTTAATSSSHSRSGGRSWMRGMRRLGMGLRSRYPESSHQPKRHLASFRMWTTVCTAISFRSSQSRYCRRSSDVTISRSLKPRYSRR